MAKKVTPKDCHYCTNNKLVVDYKDTSTLRRFVSSYMKIAPRRRSGLCAKHQRQVAGAIKKARQACLMPFIARSGLSREQPRVVLTKNSIKIACGRFFASSSIVARRSPLCFRKNNAWLFSTGRLTRRLFFKPFLIVWIYYEHLARITRQPTIEENLRGSPHDY